MPPEPPAVMMQNLPVMNVRAALSGYGGIRRYTTELCARLNGRVETIQPRAPLAGAAGHVWEQFVLPLRVGPRRVLWSPANVGPLAVERQVVTLHDAAVFDYPEGFTRTYLRWYRALLPRLVQRVAAIIAVSDFTRERIIATTGARPEQIVVVHNGVALPPAPVDPAMIAAVCHRYGIAPGAYVLAVGTLEPRKNVATLLRAWERVASRLPDDARLVLVGVEGSSRVFASQPKLPSVPRVVRAGAVSPDQLEALYAGALALANVSLYEGFGLPPLEAAARGVPVIASDIPAFREVLGGCAMLVDPNDPVAIGDAVLEIAMDDSRRRQLRELGLHTRERFSWDAAAQRTLAVLERV